MGPVVTRNPKSGAKLAEYAYYDEREIARRLATATTAQKSWGACGVRERASGLEAFAGALESDKQALGELMTDEMGKTLVEAVKEVEKCAAALRYYAKNAERMLAPREVAQDKGKARIELAPLGTVLGIMPWNFPAWQVIRFAAPTLAAGNAVLVKHADCTTGTSLALEKLARRAGLPEGVFQALLAHHDGIPRVIEDDRIAAVSLTGSERAGRSVAATAGKALKKTVLELGGSDAYVLLDDADVASAAKICVQARLQNNGQSCIAAKRFIAVASVHDAFVDAFVALAGARKIGDPREATTDIGPMARTDLRETLAKQREASLAAGAKPVLAGGPLPGVGDFFAPCVLTGVVPGMPAFDEETFGPLAAIVKAKDEADALALANRSRFGLGGAVFGRDTARAEAFARRLDCGFAVVNGMVASAPELPFGGVKASGYGRELADFGLGEFANVRTLKTLPAGN